MNTYNITLKLLVNSPRQDFPETALQGDILHHLDGSYYVYVGSKWIPLKEAMNIIYEV